MRKKPNTEIINAICIYYKKKANLIYAHPCRVRGKWMKESIRGPAGELVMHSF